MRLLFLPLLLLLQLFGSSGVSQRAFAAAAAAAKATSDHDYHRCSFDISCTLNKLGRLIRGRRTLVITPSVPSQGELTSDRRLVVVAAVIKQSSAPIKLAHAYRCLLMLNNDKDDNGRLDCELFICRPSSPLNILASLL